MTATHPAPAGIISGRSTAFRVRKLFDDLPCCHRSWAHEGKCAFLHGYERVFELEFSCSELEPDTGFVVDFGGLKEVRAALRDQFDHTTVIAEADPELPLFRELAAKGLLDLRVMPSPGMEGAAAWVYDVASEIVRRTTGGRAWVSRVEARECRKNAVTLDGTAPG
ncbi:6-carboxytetrahydropterin synthase [Amycolatopsis sp. PS_44_ISF1]|uniref:6-carboxytetrahydropterin synthase n=1 Tax=Amycolatopsis sp. PS_44_ISF1 TaxID=2974917 RepID=UPI0028DF47F1|nr:6-carboxytetrahydropterin synthase [Amycolatopsis sp. PS_44_ISF1]MDT8911797.1 6-carboxytetrahydropterin synthase [Amycolatopsis sp. PS_44_ISF1]